MPQHVLFKDTCECNSNSHLSCIQVFDEELAEVEQRVRLIAAAGADAVIVQVCHTGLLSVHLCHKAFILFSTRSLHTCRTVAYVLHCHIAVMHAVLTDQWLPWVTHGGPAALHLEALRLPEAAFALEHFDITSPAELVGFVTLLNSTPKSYLNLRFFLMGVSRKGTISAKQSLFYRTWQ